MSEEPNAISNPIKYIFIKHIDDEKTWKISLSCASMSILLKTIITDNLATDTYGMTPDNPVIINVIKSYTIPFIISYMDFYDGKPEKPAPEQPVKNIHLSTLFDTEFCLFADLCSFKTGGTAVDIKLKILMLNDHIEAASYLDISNLQKKLCAIIAAVFRDMSLSDIKKLL